MNTKYYSYEFFLVLQHLMCWNNTQAISTIASKINSCVEDLAIIWLPGILTTVFRYCSCRITAEEVEARWNLEFCLFDSVLVYIVYSIQQSNRWDYMQFTSVVFVWCIILHYHGNLCQSWLWSTGHQQMQWLQNHSLLWSYLSKRSLEHPQGILRWTIAQDGYGPSQQGRRISSRTQLVAIPSLQ